MSRYHSYINSAEKILSLYTGEEPFSAFLKKYFAADKKYGAKDRKQISNLCYCYFRTANLFKDDSAGDRLMNGLFLCSSETNDLLQNLKPEWVSKISLPAEEKCSMLNAQCSIFNLFPFSDELSVEVNQGKFSKSFLIQPDLFIRIRPGNKNTVLQKLQNANVLFHVVNDDCIAFLNSIKLDEIIHLNREAVIQDYSSQQIGTFFKSAILDLKSPIAIWDCCAASGGKSILARDIWGEIDLTVSDIRESILANLKKRFQQAGIKKYKSLVVDLTKENIQHSIINNQQSVIIADVPCSGSGTWARTPEQLSFFKKEQIERYSSLQKKIISNTIPHLAHGGYFLYITCSVFKKENEENADFIKNQFNLDLVKMKLLKGYNMKADTMFAALFKKPL
jgi:16S rRNA (cytosine967-C5)-methyltransferase